MSELKSFIVRYNGKFIRAYEQDEADKVIAELKKKLVEQATLRAWAETQLHHSNHKRCLENAKICECRTAYTCGRRLRHNLIWRERWLKLAEKFKEAK